MTLTGLGRKRSHDMLQNSIGFRNREFHHQKQTSPVIDGEKNILKKENK